MPGGSPDQGSAPGRTSRARKGPLLTLDRSAGEETCDIHLILMRIDELLTFVRIRHFREERQGYQGRTDDDRTRSIIDAILGASADQVRTDELP